MTPFVDPSKVDKDGKMSALDKELAAAQVHKDATGDHYVKDVDGNLVKISDEKMAMMNKIAQAA